jgi:hypothetical protein
MVKFINPLANKFGGIQYSTVFSQRDIDVTYLCNVFMTAFIYKKEIRGDIALQVNCDISIYQSITVSKCGT